MWVSFVLMTIYLLVLGTGSYMNGNNLNHAEQFSNWLVVGTLAAAATGIIGLAVLDIFATTSAIQSVTHSRMPFQEDLVRLTMLTPHQMVEAYRSLARVRVWSLTAGVMSYTVSLLSLVVVSYIAGWYLTGSYRVFLRWIYDFAREWSMLLALAILIALVLPIIKTRVLVAVMLAIATRFSDTVIEATRSGMVILLLILQGAYIFWAVWFPAEWEDILAHGAMMVLMAILLEQGALVLARRFVIRDLN